MQFPSNINSNLAELMQYIQQLFVLHRKQLLLCARAHLYTVYVRICMYALEGLYNNGLATGRDTVINNDLLHFNALFMLN